MGQKHNFELAFPSVPTSVDDFFGHCECTINNERRRLMLLEMGLSKSSPTKSSSNLQKKRSSIPSLDSPIVIRTVHDAPTFAIDVMKVFDERLNRWLDVQDVEQLVPWSQFYAFSTPVESEVVDSSVDYSVQPAEKQDILPSPLPIRSPAVEGHKEHTDPIFFLFHDIDVTGSGFANREDLQRIFNVLGCFEISEQSVDEMFLLYDKNRDGLLSYAEFAKLAACLPLVTEMLLGKSHEYWSVREKYERRVAGTDGAICGARFSKSEVAAVQAYLHRREELFRGQSARQLLSEKV